jgi:inosine-uridine nucleoside N-ribohydrolase
MAYNLLRILARFDQVGTVLPAGWSPVLARGARQPLAGGSPERAEMYHGEACLGGLPWTPSDEWNSRLRPLPAASAIVQAAQQFDDLYLLCIGPLTNLALATHLDPELPERVVGLTIMGGALRSGGNATIAAEFNFSADPEAASLVLEAGFRDVSLVPLDVCDEVRLMGEDVARLDQTATPASGAARDLLRFFETRATPERGLPFYDPTAWLLTTRPEAAGWENVYVTVDTGHDRGRGASLGDWHRRSRRVPNVRAAMHLADRQLLMDHFFELVR